MTDPVITNITPDRLIAGPIVKRGITLTFTAADTYVKGTILALDSSGLTYIAFVKGGSTNDNGTARAVLAEEVTVTAAGTAATTAIVGGEVFEDELVIDADGDASNVDAAVIGDLQDNNIVVQERTDQTIYDNQ